MMTFDPELDVDHTKLKEVIARGRKIKFEHYLILKWYNGLNISVGEYAGIRQTVEHGKVNSSKF